MSAYHNFLEKINKAFETGDLEFFSDHITDNIKWNIIGETKIRGKSAFIDYLKSMDTYEITKMKIKHTITDVTTAAVDGTMKVESQEGVKKSFAFCDIYEFTGETDPKIKSITSYAMEEED